VNSAGTEACLCHVIDKRGARLLLKLATRGISRGKWNGLGGKIESGETPMQCAVRECYEESGLLVSRLFRHGVLRFALARGSIVVHLFSTCEYSGRLKQSEEGRLRWFRLSELPYSRMWDDDRYWIPLMISRVRFDGVFEYDSEDLYVKRSLIVRR
jgi:8-oxo-dGTP pyrophosphatase MutT (NUDIX family)